MHTAHINIVMAGILLLLLTLTTGCHRHSAAWHSLDNAEKLISTRPDSSLLILNNIPLHDLKDEEEKARHSLLLTMAIDKNGIDTTNLDIITPAVQYYTHYGSPDDKLRTFYYQGRIYYNQGLYNLSLKSYIKAHESIAESTDTLTMGSLLADEACIQSLTLKGKEFTERHLTTARLYDLTKENLMKVAKRDRIIMFISGLILMLTCFAVFLFYRNRLQKAKIESDKERNRRLQLENENLSLESDNLRLMNKNLELEKNKLTLENDNLKLQLDLLDSEREDLKNLLSEKNNLGSAVEMAIKNRIGTLNRLYSRIIADSDNYSESYNDLREEILNNKEKFMNDTRLAFKASHPRFISYLEERDLTEAEINYVCLYAIGLRGKEVGTYIRLKRHYHVSSDVRKKLGLNEHSTNLGIYIRKLMNQL